MKIAVFGAGGIGGYFGARLAQGGGEVHLLARGRHLEALRRNGLRVRSSQGDVTLHLPATDRPQEIGASDVVLFCVKATDTESAAAELPPLLHETTVVVTLQNGVDNEERIASAIGASHVAGGAAYILATIGEPGVIEHQGTLARMVFGELDGSRSRRLEELLTACKKGKVEAEISSDIRRVLWQKYALICAVAGMTAAVRLPLGEIRRSENAMRMIEGTVEEVVRVAAAVGVALPEETAAGILETVRKLPGEWTSSLHYDMTHGKPMELETLQGTLVRLAQRHSVAVPWNDSLYSLLDPWSIRNR